jgi:predicted neutral ceramidase superfamily lipid hydrolase
MSPNTAGCFLLFGIAKIMVRVDKYIPILKGSQISLYLVVFLLSILSIVGYITKKHFLFSWGSVTGMALHTSACFLILSIVKIRFKAFRLKIQILGIVLSSLIFTAFLVAWLYSIDQQDRRINAKINKDLAIIYSNLDKKTQPRV